jgi:PilZ domain
MRRQVRLDRARKVMVTSVMSWLLVVQPDSVQADVLCEALRAHLSEDVVVADSLDSALSSIDQGVPDIVLLSAVIPAAVEDYLVTYLGTIPGARHVQILVIPVLEGGDDSVQGQARSLIPYAVQRRAGSLIPDFVQQRVRSLIPRRRRPESLTPGCDPEMFTQDVIDYLSGARALKHEIELHNAQAALSERAERRSEPRFPNYNVPWISIRRYGNGRAVLINVSSRGVRLRTQTRPEHHSLKRSDPNVRERSRLTFELNAGHEVHVMGRVVRCVPLRTGAGIQYDIAFSFDHSVGLHLPVASALIPKPSGTENDGG